MNKINTLTNQDLKQHHLINKFVRFSSLKHKIFIVAFFATHLPLFCLIAYLLFGQDDINKNVIVILALCSTLVGTALVLWVLHHLLKPIQICSKTLKNFLKSGRLDNFPTHINDEMGVMLKNLSKTLNALNKRQTELKETSFRDYLTGLANRLSATEKLEALIAEGQEFCLTIIDIDHFKQVNDKHGHLAGDAALKQFGDFLGTFLKKHSEYAWAARWGGEEFLLVIPGDIEFGQQLMEKLRIKTEQNNINYEKLVFQFTISIGLTQYNFDTDINDNIKAADKALFTAKKTGRNQVIVHAS